MSGGHFDYVQFNIEDAISKLDSDIKQQYQTDLVDKFGYDYSYGFSKETLLQLELGLLHLKVANIYLHRIDWLLSGDDGEDRFHARLKEELQPILNLTPTISIDS